MTDKYGRDKEKFTDILKRLIDLYNEYKGIGIYSDSSSTNFNCLAGVCISQKLIHSDCIKSNCIFRGYWRADWPFEYCDSVSVVLSMLR